MATIRKRVRKDGKNYYQSIVRLQGFKSASASFPSRSQAKAWAVQTENEIRQDKFFGFSESSKHTVAEMLDRYCETEISKITDGPNRARQLDLWREKLGKMKIADVKTPHIVKARDELLTERQRGKGQRSGATVNRLLGALSHVFSVAETEWEWATHNPVKKVKRFKENAGRTRFLSDDEREALLKATAEVSPVMHLITVVALSTAARKGDILGLKWSDVDLKAGRAIARDTKNTETRSLTLSGYALELFKEHAKVRQIDSELVFPPPAGKQEWPFKSHWNRAVKKAEIKDFKFHDCRHSAASYLAMRGASAPELAAILGHKTLQMVKRYAHLSDQHTSTVVAEMNAEIFGK